MPNILPVGKLDRLITIEEPTESVGADYGEKTIIWSTFKQMWANVYSGGGREFEAARQVSAEIDTQFQVRYIYGISAKMRIGLPDMSSPVSVQYYDIIRLQEVGRKQRINIWARAKQE